MTSLRARARATALLFVAACSRPSAPPAPTVAQAMASPSASESVAPSASATAPAPPAAAAFSIAAPPPVAPRIGAAEARSLLFPPGDATAPACEDAGAVDPTPCLLAARYAAAPSAAAVARSLYETTGDVAGLLPAETMEGGFRGTLHLVPELPVRGRQRHLEWVASAAADYDDFFHRLTASDPDHARNPVPYRWRALGFRFMRSVSRTTPSAYATGWTVAYNVDGSLNTSRDAVRELLFHEIFHLNDAAHGDWSVRALGAVFDSIVSRCHVAMGCLAPYAPTDTRVRGGTYYAFQPDNGEAVHEYAAELALRYYREERAVLRGERPLAAFKCGPPENARAWHLLVDEFFGGLDRTPACP